MVIGNQAFIRAVLVSGKYGSVLCKAMRDPISLQLILSALSDAGCFASEGSKQAFIDAVCSPDCIGRTCFYYAQYSHAAQSIKLIHEHLKQAGGFTSDENKQKLINAIFARCDSGQSALLNASSSDSCTASVLGILTEAGCFEGSNQQVFVNAVFAADEHGRNCLYNSLNGKHILNQLMKIKYFEGPFAEQNKNNFINAVFASVQIGKSPQGSAFSRNCTYSAFPLLMEHLNAAGCFSADSANPHKLAFFNAALAPDESGRSVLSQIYRSGAFILVLKKLAEAGCFENPEYKMKFCQAIRANGNAILLNTMKDLRDYLALHKNLVLAGFSAQDIKDLLNEPVQRKYCGWPVATPLMLALRYKNDLLAARLIADGAELTDQQKQQVEEFHHKSQQRDDKVEPFDRAAVKDKLIQPEKSGFFKKPKLERRVSVSNLSIFAEKQSGVELKYAADDIAVKSSTLPR